MFPMGDADKQGEYTEIAADADVGVLVVKRRSCSSGSSVYKGAAMLVAVMTFIAILLLAEFLRGHVMPMVTNVNQVINKADVVFSLLYEYLCQRTQLVSPTDCSILQSALSLS
jgi:hypothetical protein